MEQFLTLEGNTDDLLMINSDNSMKATRLIRLDPKSSEINEEIIDLAITSTNMNGNHSLFDKILGKKIKISVDIID